MVRFGLESSFTADCSRLDIYCKLLTMSNDPTEIIVNGVKVMMSNFAVFLNKISRGKLSPSYITTLSLIGHIPAAWALWTNRPILGAILIAVFGLMDSLDGALARVQNTASKLGMFFDATTDRLKEVIIYSGLAVYISVSEPKVGVWVVPAVVGSSLLVSYVKAKGEMAVSAESHDRQALNRAFSQGIARYEIRMALLILGLVTGLLPSLLNLIIALNMLTAAIRFLEVAKLLNLEDSKVTIKHTTQRKNAKS